MGMLPAHQASQIDTFLQNPIVHSSFMEIICFTLIFFSRQGLNLWMHFNSDFSLALILMMSHKLGGEERIQLSHKLGGEERIQLWRVQTMEGTTDSCTEILQALELKLIIRF